MHARWSDRAVHAMPRREGGDISGIFCRRKRHHSGNLQTTKAIEKVHEDK